jgi:hypothetical protein
MSGHGGYKHRTRALRAKRRQRRLQARQNVVRIRAGVEAKGQTWDPKNNPAQLAALNHAGRRHVQTSEMTFH